MSLTIETYSWTDVQIGWEHASLYHSLDWKTRACVPDICTNIPLGSVQNQISRKVHARYVELVQSVGRQKPVGQSIMQVWIYIKTPCLIKVLALTENEGPLRRVI